MRSSDSAWLLMCLGSFHSMFLLCLYIKRFLCPESFWHVVVLLLMHFWLGTRMSSFVGWAWETWNFCFSTDLLVNILEWVRLPGEVMESPSLETFKTHLDAFLWELLYVIALAREVGLDDFQRSLLSPSLWFYVLQSTDTKNEPWRAPLVAGHQQDIVPYSTII